MGGTALIVHPRYLFAALEPSVYESYKERNRVRYLKSYKAMTDMMITNSLVKIKDAPPYSKELEGPVLLNSLARTTLDKKTNSYIFRDKLQSEVKPNLANVKAVKESLKTMRDTAGVGVDQGKCPLSINS